MLGYAFFFFFFPFESLEHTNTWVWKRDLVLDKTGAGDKNFGVTGIAVEIDVR